MTCGEVREYLFAFLDSELDAPLSIEIQRHIGRCAECAREVEIERAIRRAAAERFDAAVSRDASDEAVLRGVLLQGGARRSARPRFLLRRGTIALTSTAAVALLCTFAWLGLRPNAGRPTQPHFAAWIVADFEHVVRDGLRVQFASGDPADVATWLRDQTGLVVSLPAGRPARCDLIGARRCEIDGRPAAFAMYRIGGVPASLVVTEDRGLDIEPMARVAHPGVDHWLDRCKGHTVVARKRGKLMYAAVSTLPESDILCLLTGGTHEGD